MGGERDLERLADLLHWGAATLRQAGIEEARTDAEVLLSFCLSLSRTGLYLAGAERPGAAQAGRFREMIARRCAREPVAYITGEREFWSRSFQVTRDVLIPRPETEFLVETVLAVRGGVPPPERYLDICCGSGVIVIVVALELGCGAVAVDISGPALEVCRKNCARHGLDSRISLVQADLGGSFRPTRPFSLITANPPYVSRAEIDEGLPPEVARFEPHLALDGGRDGLELIGRICADLELLLAPGGDFFMEIGAGQGEQVRAALAQADRRRCFASIEVHKDYGGRDRVVRVKRR